jgi:glutathione peroxidase
MGYHGVLYGKIECDNSAATHPLFASLMTSLDNGIFGPSLKWNFAKFLCDADGIPVERFSPQTSLLAFEEKIVEVLNRIPAAK